MLNDLTRPVARPTHRIACATLLAAAILLHGCQLLARFSLGIREACVQELYKLSIEELLRVAVITDLKRHLPLTPLVDLTIEELLLIEAVRQDVLVTQSCAAID